MEQDQKQIDLLARRLNKLVDKQEQFSEEIRKLRTQIEELRSKPVSESPDVEVERPPSTVIEESRGPIEKDTSVQEEVPDRGATKVTKKSIGFVIKSDLEKFIGENLISKIGIGVTIIGVSIGVKYSIDNELITPLMRVIAGYLTGVILLLVGVKLKTKYEQYSAVLVSGAMAIMYFITYVAFSYYDLMPLSLAFIAMVLFTIFVVLAAISYNQQVISLVGLVGAYAVPFLLSDEPGDIRILLGYISIINIGIAILALLKYWKLLYYSSFVLSWGIFLTWFGADFLVEEHFYLTLVFSLVFFFTFYITFLGYKLVKKETFQSFDIVFLLLNSFIYYGVGYVTLNQHAVGQNYLGHFTLANGILHLIVSIIVFRLRRADRNLFYFIFGLVLVFITIAIPVQLDGRWVTLLWIGEATALFWVGKNRKSRIYENLSYIMIIISFFSLLQDWAIFYESTDLGESSETIGPIFNIQFLSSLIFIACLGYITFLRQSKLEQKVLNSKSFGELVNYAVPTLLMLTIFLALRFEIAFYWDLLMAKVSDGGEANSVSNIRSNDLHRFKTVWLINYSIVYFIICSLLNMTWIKNVKLVNINIVLNGIVVYIFLLHALFVISELRENYLDPTLGVQYQTGLYYVLIRYISILFVAILIVVGYRYIRRDFVVQDFRMPYSILMHISIAWILSSELIHWFDIGDLSAPYKLGLSILWGAYSLFLIILGIWKKTKYLRIMGISLFAITLIKLFFYDITELDTIPKTILFVSLGVLLLVISFLYNKYKHLISE
jgi:uncharacterized membrane protein